MKKQYIFLFISLCSITEIFAAYQIKIDVLHPELPEYKAIGTETDKSKFCNPDKDENCDRAYDLQYFFRGGDIKPQTITSPSEANTKLEITEDPDTKGGFLHVKLTALTYDKKTKEFGGKRQTLGKATWKPKKFTCPSKCRVIGKGKWLEGECIERDWHRKFKVTIDPTKPVGKWISIKLATKGKNVDRCWPAKPLI